MANNNPQQSGSGPPPKPWEQAGTSSGPAPFKPSSPGSTSDVVEASGTARPGEMVPANDALAVNTNTLGRPVPARPWMQQNTYGSTYGGAGYGGGLNYNSGYGTGTYGSYGGLGATGSYNTGLYGSNMYGGGGGYGGLYGSGGGMYGGVGMYNNGYGGTMGGYGMGMGGGPGGPYGDQDPNNPFGAAPSSPPGFWISLMRVMHGVVTFFGRVAMLIDQNTQAFHMFMSALLQLFDRSGMLYGELARFVFRLLRVKTKPNKIRPAGPNRPQVPQNFEPPKAAPAAGSWDRVWGNNTNN
ncbi:hypothetical protein CTI12_AA473940 [Artemisia annua]|uniref:Peroxin-13 n=1 Tax=Artemisia annua TaxID=35608 RepID=A0A2U1LMD4_ARTAN|nr:hypothetical protein CTI12_AA473940 [Artemisia annua]